MVGSFTLWLKYLQVKLIGDVTFLLGGLNTVPQIKIIRILVFKVYNMFLFLVYSQSFNVGDAVEVKINELEMTGHFLGQYKRITLCEADVSLVDGKL